MVWTLSGYQPHRPAEEYNDDALIGQRLKRAPDYIHFTPDYIARPNQRCYISISIRWAEDVEDFEDASGFGRLRRYCRVQEH